MFPIQNFNNVRYAMNLFQSNVQRRLDVILLDNKQIMSEMHNNKADHFEYFYILFAACHIHSCVRKKAFALKVKFWKEI